MPAGDVLCYKRRYAVVRENVSDERTLSMPLTMLGRPEWACVTPRGDLRFKQQGGASPYMHGGLSLQELVVPLIAYRNRKAGQKGYRAITKADIVLLGENRTISNGIFTLVFYQQEACGGKVQPRTVNARFVDRRGQPSATATASSATAPRRRTTTAQRASPSACWAAITIKTNVTTSC